MYHDMLYVYWNVWYKWRYDINDMYTLILNTYGVYDMLYVYWNVWYKWIYDIYIYIYMICIHWY